MSFNIILEKYRGISFSQKDKGNRFERLMQAYLLTDPQYTSKLKNVWLWTEFHGKSDLGGGDTGIDLVAKTFDGDYWAIQCKCFQENSRIDKPAVDSFLATSSREFKNEELITVRFSHRLWISTTNHWGPNAEEAIRSQNPAVTRINLYNLQDAPVDWKKLDNGIHGEQARNTTRELKTHQRAALENTNFHFKTADRGKLVMACGTGKTFNSLRIAENETGGKGLVLFLVPSIALLGQTLREWSTFAVEPINAICICSDPEITRQRNKNLDSDGASVVDLALPASTNPQDILRQFGNIKERGNPGMTVVFSTYQSIEVIARAQSELLNNGFKEFDLIICDEAHRTTGVSLAGEDESAFTKVHNNEFIRGKKRLYMTATPRLYNDDSKSKAAQADAILCSMDDSELYGEEIYRIGFGEAVIKGLLTDYKVLILTLSEQDVPPAVQKMLQGESSEISTDDTSKLIGCINALSKQILGDHGIIKETDPEPMKRAVAFCQSIAASKTITDTYNSISDTYVDSLPGEKREKMVSLSSKHVDGTMSAPDRDERLAWLKAETDDNECRVLTNVRCLSEGVDVPSLDAVMFLSARNSQVDVVQSVGRVMRLSPGTNKKYGYIIIPVVVPSNIEADIALDNNDRYKVVWTVLNALRAHDDRFNATVNKIELNKSRPSQILVGRPEYTFDGNGNASIVDDKDSRGNSGAINNQIALQFEQLQNVVFARMVNKVGDRRYWEQWAKSVAEIAERQAERINRLISEDKLHQEAFANFLGGLQKNINPSISKQEAVEMLSQHIITKPVFEALFDGYSFVKNNPISVSMQTMLDLLEAQTVEKDAETLQKFYESVKMRASGIDNVEGKQRIIIELYDKFFKTAFPKMVEQLGIVYTPIEVVDFIIHSVNDVLKKEFGRSLSDENVNILDPFTGTGTFITRLLQSGLIDKKDLLRKYQNEIYANEIVLLAYYIAAVNIENAFHDAMDLEEYLSFDGICLTDTFQLGESDHRDKIFKEMFPQNSERVAKQKNAPLQVIIGNPPYSVGQKSANDDAQNQKYENLEKRILNTYAKESGSGLKASLYDSYIKAFRWSSDRIDAENGGVLCFVSNGAWLDSNTSSGFRKCLEKEFASIYVFNLRGNQRTKGELSRQEGGKIFGSGSRTPISVTLLVKNANKVDDKAKIYYHDIGDYLTREEKLDIVGRFRSVLNPDMNWNMLNPNEHADWVSQRNDAFDSFIPCAPEKKYDSRSKSYFTTFSLGISTNRDAFCYNSSIGDLKTNIHNTIDFYNSERLKIHQQMKDNPELAIDKLFDYNSARVNWTDIWKRDLKNNIEYTFEEKNCVIGMYRPFFKQNFYYSNILNHRVYQQPKLFPFNGANNVVICISSSSNDGVAVLIADAVPNLHFNGDSQCFPLYYYEENQKETPTLFDKDNQKEDVRRDGISDFILERARKIYGKTITKEDIFYYVYGFLHSPEYRLEFVNDLKKMLPKLPLVEDVRDFWKFSKAGRNLAELHLGYEKLGSHPDVVVAGADSGFFQVEKMRFPKKDQKGIIQFNSQITISNIPLCAYKFMINGKSAVEWVMERYATSVHKDSGIKNDPNDWAKEVGNPRYILDLLLSVINISVQTVDIVNSLPKIKFE